MSFDYMLRRDDFHRSQTQVIENFITDEEAKLLMEETNTVDFRLCPVFLGRFKMACFGEHYGRGRKLPPAHKAAALKMMALKADQAFNCAFIQKYSQTERVKLHQDPFDNVGHTLILTYGTFQEYRFRATGRSLMVKPNTLIVLPCTMEFEGKMVQGPEHYADEAKGGERFSLILNTIKR